VTEAEAFILAAIATYLVVVALLCGSFINLAADRLPRGESIVHPRSHCRACGRVLNLVDLAPVLGYGIRRGRCATCRVGIGLSSPAVEAMCGSVMLVAIGLFGLARGAMIGAAGVGLVGLVTVGQALVRARVARRESRSG
jgi:prepilin signal peptidase PulO-like enzyme (type II secretory pathway)